MSASLLRRTSLNPINNLKKFYKTDMSNVNGVWIDIDKKRLMKMKYFNEILMKFKDNTYCQGHLPYSKLLEELLEKNNIKMIYIIRDPRDVVVSHFHHHKRDRNYEGFELMNNLGSDKERILMSLKGFNLGTEFESSSMKNKINNSIGWYHSKSRNILSLKFEEIIGELGGGESINQKMSIDRICEFLKIDGKKLLNNMDQIFYTKSSTFRKGIIGDWVNYYDEDVKIEVKNEIGNSIISLSYEESNDW